MFSFNTTPAVSWPSSSGPNIAPVQPVAAPTAVKRSSSESNPQGGDPRQFTTFTRSGRVPEGQEPTSSEPQAAPLLPRERSPEEQEAAERAQAQATEEAEQQDEAEAAQEAAVQPQQLLSNVWQASGKVVEQLLGKPIEEVTAHSMNRSAEGSAPPSEEKEVVAYDESGNGTTAPVELGVIISERV